MDNRSNDDIFNGYPVPVVKGYIAKAGDLGIIN